MRFLGFVLLLIAAWGFYAAFRPRRAWRAAEGWAYANPDAVEPSDAGYALKSIGSFIGAVAALIAAGLLLFTPTPEQRAEEAEAAQLACREVMRELRAVADFDGYELINSREVEAVAADLGVQVEIDHTRLGFAGVDSSPSVSTLVFVRDSQGNSMGSLSATLGASCY